MTYIAIDLKSFYASVECMERGLDPLFSHLVVADATRTEKTICLAVSPSLKVYGIKGRARLFEVVQRVREVNRLRALKRRGRVAVGMSIDARDLANDPMLDLDYVVAVPQMKKYMEKSAQIYETYLQFVSAEDVHVYSIDEVFIDVTPYLKHYGGDARVLAKQMIAAVYAKTGITATAGIGTNLYLCKVAMDILAKHVEPDTDGVRIAMLDERSYREKLWDHQPLTDFWRVGKGIAEKLQKNGMYSMLDVAEQSLRDEEVLFKLFGIQAELLIDHAWGVETCTMRDIKAYQPDSHSLASGQVLSCGYCMDKARLIVKEMADQMALDLTAKGLVSDQLVLTLAYDRSTLMDPEKLENYTGAVEKDRYGRIVPKSAHGSARLKRPVQSSLLWRQAALRLFDRIVDPQLLVRKVNLCAMNVRSIEEAKKENRGEQLDLFHPVQEENVQQEEMDLKKEQDVQKAILEVRKRFGKNAVLKGMDLEEGATVKERNNQIGGHKA